MQSSTTSSNSSSLRAMSLWMESLYKSTTRCEKKEQHPVAHQKTTSDKVLAKVAVQKVNDFENSWNLFHSKRHVRQVEWNNNVKVGKLLGKGTFAAVHEVQLNSDETKTYAMKSLHDETMANRSNFLAGAVDLAVEARILASLSHENIIQLHGVRAGTFQDSLETCDYFLIVDLLVQTLEDLLKHERFQQEMTFRKKKNSKWRRVVGDRIALSIGHRPCYHDASLYGRLETVAMGIAQGMEYLHSQHVCFRDLKPANVGFDSLGHVKIFDFGLAREVRGGKFAGGQQVGSPRYMAPEVAKCEPYGISADVYSFGVLLWEICTLEKPYQEMNSQQLLERVVLGDERPPLNHDACFFVRHSKLKILLQGCWHPLPTCRPSFSTIIKELELELKETNPVAAAQVTKRRLPFLRKTDGQEVPVKHFWRGKLGGDKTSCQEEETVVFDR